tara:strand:- start:736 stop:1056 length:321 start_codon:yes stop_codon:yes gene_type:complete
MGDTEIAVKVKKEVDAEDTGSFYYIFDFYNIPLKYWNVEDEKKLIHTYLESIHDTLDNGEVSIIRPEYIQLGDWLDDLSSEEMEAIKLSSDKEEDGLKLIQPSEEE